MKATNTSNYRKKVGGVWFEPGETKEVENISEDEFSYYFELEDDDTAPETESGENVDEEEEESSKSETKNDKGD